MSSLRRFVIIGALAQTTAVMTVGVPAALAADMPGDYPPPPPIKRSIDVIANRGWYVRGDVGYGWTHMRGASYYQGGPDGTKTDFDDTDLDGGVVLGGGVGYQWNDYFRTDVTLDYLFDGDFNGSTSGSCGVSDDCVSSDRASWSALSLLANAYVDLGTYYGVTPYVGAGIGATRVNWGDLRNTSCSVDDPGDCDDTVTHSGKDDWRFTYALSAGASYEFHNGMKLDVGYRFTDVAGGDMFSSADASGRDDGFKRHEFRVGLRLSIW